MYGEIAGWNGAIIWLPEVGTGASLRSKLLIFISKDFDPGRKIPAIGRDKLPPRSIPSRE
jgi:hypothetical protein